MLSDNPAARLLQILERGRSIPTNRNCRETWQILLDAKDCEESVLISRIGKLMDLPQQAIELLEANFPNQIKNTNYWRRQISSAFAEQILSNPWQSFIQYIDDHTVMYLSLTADLLAQKVVSHTLPEETLKSLKDQVDNLIEQVMGSNLDEDIKRTISRHLHKISTALGEYRISGASTIMDTVESALGHSFYDKRYYEALSDPKSEIGAKFISLLSAISSAMTIELGAPQLADSAKMLLQYFK